MAKGIYTGVGGKARKGKKVYLGLGGKAYKVKKGYIGVDGKAKQFFNSGTASGIYWAVSNNNIAGTKLYHFDKLTGSIRSTAIGGQKRTSYGFGTLEKMGLRMGERNSCWEIDAETLAEIIDTGIVLQGGNNEFVFQGNSVYNKDSYILLWNLNMSGSPTLRGGAPGSCFAYRHPGNTYLYDADVNTGVYLRTLKSGDIHAYYQSADYYDGVYTLAPVVYFNEFSLIDYSTNSSTGVVCRAQEANGVNFYAWPLFVK